MLLIPDRLMTNRERILHFIVKCLGQLMHRPKLSSSQKYHLHITMDMKMLIFLKWLKLDVKLDYTVEYQIWAGLTSLDQEADLNHT